MVQSLCPVIRYSWWSSRVCTFCFLLLFFECWFWALWCSTDGNAHEHILIVVVVCWCNLLVYMSGGWGVCERFFCLWVVLVSRVVAKVHVWENNNNQFFLFTRVTGSSGVEKERVHMLSRTFWSSIWWMEKLGWVCCWILQLGILFCLFLFCVSLLCYRFV